MMRLIAGCMVMAMIMPQAAMSAESMTSHDRTFARLYYELQDFRKDPGFLGMGLGWPRAARWKEKVEKLKKVDGYVGHAMGEYYVSPQDLMTMARGYIFSNGHGDNVTKALEEEFSGLLAKYPDTGHK